jgi:hypothetical protein
MQTFDLMPPAVNQGDVLSTHRNSQTEFGTGKLPVVQLPLVMPHPQSRETISDKDQSGQTNDLFNMISDENLLQINR